MSLTYLISCLWGTFHLFWEVQVYSVQICKGFLGRWKRSRTDITLMDGKATRKSCISVLDTSIAIRTDGAIFGQGNFMCVKRPRPSLQRNKLDVSTCLSRECAAPPLTLAEKCVGCELSSVSLSALSAYTRHGSCAGLSLFLSTSTCLTAHLLRYIIYYLPALDLALPCTYMLILEPNT